MIPRLRQRARAADAGGSPAEVGLRPQLRSELPPALPQRGRPTEPCATCSTWPRRSACRASTAPVRSGSSSSSRASRAARAAMIQKVHHSVTDGVGGVEIALSMLDLEREPTDDLGPMPGDARGRRTSAAIELMQRRLRPRGAPPSAASCRAFAGEVDEAVRTPSATASTAADVAASLVARCSPPRSSRCSPIMTGRSLSARYDHITVSLPDLKAAAKRGGRQAQRRVCRRASSAACASYHAHHGVDVDALRMAHADSAFATRRLPVPAVTSSCRRALPCR